MEITVTFNYTTELIEREVGSGFPYRATSEDLARGSLRIEGKSTSSMEEAVADLHYRTNAIFIDLLETVGEEHEELSLNLTKI